MLETGNEHAGSQKGNDRDSDRDRRKFEVAIIYNGVKKALTVALDEPMNKVLQQAIALFGSPPNPHTLALFTEAGRELPENVSVREAGLVPHQTLLLRPSTVKGG